MLDGSHGKGFHGGAAEQCDGLTPVGRSAVFPEGTLHFFNLFKNRLGVLQGADPIGGQADSGSGAVQKGNSKLLLQLGNGLTEALGRYV